MTGLLATAGRPAGRAAVGAAVAVVSALLYDIGYVLEKQALAGAEQVRAHPASLLSLARRSPRWTAGFVSMLAGLGLQVVALTLAPVSVVQPILAGGLIALAAAGSSVLGERLTRRHGAALGLVLVAVVAVAVSARAGARVAGSVPAGRFAALTVPVAVVALLLARAGTRGPARRSLIGVAGGAGLLYGIGAVAEKAVATAMVQRGLVGGLLASLATAYPWLFLVATLAGMLVFQVGLQAHPASLMAALTNGLSGGYALLGAGVVFAEPLLPGGWWLPVRVAGLVAVVAAVAALGADREPASGVGPDAVPPEVLALEPAAFPRRAGPAGPGLPPPGPAARGATSPVER